MPGTPGGGDAIRCGHQHGDAQWGWALAEVVRGGEGVGRLFPLLGGPPEAAPAGWSPLGAGVGSGGVGRSLRAALAGVCVAGHVAFLCLVKVRLPALHAPFLPPLPPAQLLPPAPPQPLVGVGGEGRGRVRKGLQLAGRPPRPPAVRRAKYLTPLMVQAASAAALRRREPLAAVAIVPASPAPPLPTKKWAAHTVSLPPPPQPPHSPKRECRRLDSPARLSKLVAAPAP